VRFLESTIIALSLPTGSAHNASEEKEATTFSLIFSSSANYMKLLKFAKQQSKTEFAKYMK
jgi:hypothetical protein